MHQRTAAQRSRERMDEAIAPQPLGDMRWTTCRTCTKVTYQFLRLERCLAWRFQDHHRPVDMDDRYSRDSAQLDPKVVRLRRNHIAMLVRLACVGELLLEMGKSLHGRTDNTGEALVARNSLSMITFPPLKRLRKIYGRLFCLALEIELVYAALCDHYTAASPCIQSTPCLLRRVELTELHVALKDRFQLLCEIKLLCYGSLAHLRVDCASTSQFYIHSKSDKRTQNLIWLSKAERHAVERHEFAICFGSFLTHDDQRGT